MNVLLGFGELSSLCCVAIDCVGILAFALVLLLIEFSFIFISN